MMTKFTLQGGIYSSSVKVDKLPVYKNNGTVIEYTIKKIDVEKYTAVITSDVNGSFIITNTHIPAKTQINVTKIWDDNNNQDGIRPESVTVELYADGVFMSKK